MGLCNIKRENPNIKNNKLAAQHWYYSELGKNTCMRRNSTSIYPPNCLYTVHQLCWHSYYILCKQSQRLISVLYIYSYTGVIFDFCISSNDTIYCLQLYFNAEPINVYYGYDARIFYVCLSYVNRFVLLRIPDQISS